MRLGIIFCAWGTLDLVPQSLAPWVELRARYMQHFDERSSVHICAISTQFAGFEGKDDGTREWLRGALERGDIDKLVDSPDGMTEVEARSLSMYHLVDHGATHIWQVDSDEIYSTEDIKNIIQYIAENPWTVWWRICLKNYVFDTKTYLADPFCPPRIFTVNIDGYEAHSFSGDNDIQYAGIITRDILHQSAFSSGCIPQNRAWITHLSWISNERSRRKVEYQLRRGWNPSFLWQEDQLVFNTNYPTPKILKDDS